MNHAKALESSLDGKSISSSYASIPSCPPCELSIIYCRCRILINNSTPFTVYTVNSLTLLWNSGFNASNLSITASFLPIADASVIRLSSICTVSLVSSISLSAKFIILTKCPCSSDTFDISALTWSFPICRLDISDTIQLNLHDVRTISNSIDSISDSDRRCSANISAISARLTVLYTFANSLIFCLSRACTHCLAKPMLLSYSTIVSKELAAAQRMDSLQIPSFPSTCRLLLWTLRILSLMLRQYQNMQEISFLGLFRSKRRYISVDYATIRPTLMSVASADNKILLTLPSWIMHTRMYFLYASSWIMLIAWDGAEIV